jgi:hypothetical protein
MENTRRRKLSREMLGQAYTEGIWCPGDTKRDINYRRKLKALNMPESVYLGEAILLSFCLKAVKEAPVLAIKHARQAFKADHLLQEYTYVHKTNMGFAIEQTVSRDEVLKEAPTPVTSSSSSSPPPPVEKKPTQSVPKRAKEPVSLLKAKEMFVRRYLKQHASIGSKLSLTCQAHTAWDKLAPSEQEAQRYK